MEAYCGVVARIDRRHRLERGRELQRLPVADVRVVDVGRGHRLDPPLAERRAHRLGHQLVRDLVVDLVAEPLLHHRGRHLARPEPGHPRRPADVPGDAGAISASTSSAGISMTRFFFVSETSIKSLFMDVIGLREAGSSAEGLRVGETQFLDRADRSPSTAGP